MHILSSPQESMTAQVRSGGKRASGSTSDSIRWYWLVFAFTLIVDLISKWIVTRTMILQQSVPLLGTIVKLTYVRNTGAAFSLLADFHSPWRTVLFIAVPVIAIATLTWVAYRERFHSRQLVFSLGLVCGGALGNLLDRIRFGTVVDFIELSYHDFHWPVFNLADSAVVAGVSLLLIITFRNQPQRRRIIK